MKQLGVLAWQTAAREDVQRLWSVIDSPWSGLDLSGGSSRPVDVPAVGAPSKQKRAINTILEDFRKIRKTGR